MAYDPKKSFLDNLDFGTVGDFALPALPGGDSGVMSFGAAAPVVDGILINPGFTGSSPIKSYTLALDVYVSSAYKSKWFALLQTDPTNLSDADVLVNTAGGVGISGNYTGTFTYDAWHRIVLTVQNTDSTHVTLSKYIDGTLVGTQTGLDASRFQIDPVKGFLIFADNGATGPSPLALETEPGYASSVMFTDQVLTGAQVSALGGADADGILSAPLSSGQTVQFDFNASTPFAPTMGAGTLQAISSPTNVLTGTTFGTTSSLGIPTLSGDNGTDTVMAYVAAPATQGYLVKPGIAASAADGKIHDYTLVMDIYAPASNGRWMALLQTDPTNVSDSDFLFNGTTGVGISGNYKGTFSFSGWNRVAVTIHTNADGSVDMFRYINGTAIDTTPFHPSGSGGTAGARYAIDPATGFLIFSDNGGSEVSQATPETAPGYVDSVYFTDSALTAAQISALGGTKAGGVVATGSALADPAHAVQFDFTGGDLAATVGNANGTIGLWDQTLGVVTGDQAQAADDTVITAHDTPVTISASQLLANDPNPQGYTLSITHVANGTGGTASLDANGNVVFTPNAGFNGQASFSYTLSDGHGVTDTANVIVKVAAPTDVLTGTAFGTTGSIGIPDLAGGNGTDGVLAYVGASATQGYSVKPGIAPTSSDGLIHNYTVMWDVYAPSAQGNWMALLQTDPTNVTDADFLLNSANGIGISGSYVGAFNYSGWNRIAVTIQTNADGTVTMERYINGTLVGSALTPDPREYANDAARYAIDPTKGFLIFSDNGGAEVGIAGPETSPGYVSSVMFTDQVLNATQIGQLGGAQSGGIIPQGTAVDPAHVVQFDFTDGNLAPSIGDGTMGLWDKSLGVVTDGVAAVDDSGLSTAHDTPLTLTAAQLLSNDVDLNGGELTITSVADGVGGTVALDHGNVVFTPDAGFKGQASFTYTASDGDSTDEATVTVDVQGLTAKDDTGINTGHDTPLAIAASQLLANDVEPHQGDTLTITGVTSGTGGTATLNADGSVLFTPDANFEGQASFTYTIMDSHGDTSSANVSVHVGIDPQVQESRHVLFIGLDGTQYSELLKLGALTSSVSNLYHVDGYAGGDLGTPTQQQTVSGPGWSTLLTGVWVNEHGITSNTSDHINPAVETLFQRINSGIADATLASIVQWGPINQTYFANDAGLLGSPSILDWQASNISQAAVTQQGIDLVTNDAPTFTFLHFDDVDAAGHASGFGPVYNQAMITAAEEVLQLEIAVAQREAANPDEDWMIVIATDHGREPDGFSHGPQNPTDRAIFIDSNKPLEYDGTGAAPQTSVAATIADFLGLDESGIRGPSLLDLGAADTVAPWLLTATPGEDTQNVAVNAPLSIIFDERMEKGTGNIVIHSAVDGSVVETIDVNSADVTISAGVVTVHQTAQLAASTDYYVTVDAGAFDDLAGNAFAGINDAATWTFKTAADTTPPAVTGTTPADNVTAVAPNAPLVITFDEAVRTGEGSIVLHHADGSVVETIDVTSNAVSINGNTVSIQPSAPLAAGDYYVTVSDGAFQDLVTTVPVTLYSENFDELAPLLQPYAAADSDQTEWTATLPSGWTETNNTPGGASPFWGWTFQDPAAWIAQQGDQGRSGFTKAHGVIAVADPDAADDFHNIDPNLFSALLKTPEINVAGVAGNHVTLSFDNSWANPTSNTNIQEAEIVVTFSNGQTLTLAHWSDQSGDPNFKATAINESLSFDIPVPDGATTMNVAFNMMQAGNAYWWAIDNVKVTAEEDHGNAAAGIDGATAWNFTVSAADDSVIDIPAGTFQTTPIAVTKTVDITVEGILATMADGARAIDASNALPDGTHLTVDVAAGGQIMSEDDAVRVAKNLPDGAITIDNAGTIHSATGQAIDLANEASASTVISITNEAGGVIIADDADAIRPGVNAIINNAGQIIASSPDEDSNDAIDFQHAGTGEVDNHSGGTISGARHGITGDHGITVTNDVGGTIIGNSGSAVNIDNGDNGETVNVTNHGTMTGTAQQGYTDSDGDAVDVDGLLHLVNNGLIQGIGAVGYHNGQVNISEGIAAGGGYIENDEGGVIYGYGRAIQIDDSNNGAAPAAVTIINKSLILGDGNGPAGVSDVDAAAAQQMIDGREAIDIIGSNDDHITNTGMIVGGIFTDGGSDMLTNAAAIDSDTGSFIDGTGVIDGQVDMGDGNDTVTLGAGSYVTGSIMLGDGADVLDASAVAATVIVNGTAYADHVTVDGGAGNDTITGTAGDDTIHGGAGDDMLTGGAGSDTYTYASGDGSDTIVEAAGASGNDALVFQNVSSGDVDAMYKHGDDVQIVLKDGSTITIEDQLAGGGVESATFSDGLVIGADQVANYLTDRGPVATDKVLDTVTEDAPAFTVSFATLLAGSSDADLDTLSISNIGDFVGGTAVLTADGVQFTLDANHNGTASFSFTVDDGRGGTAVAYASFDVTPVNDAPVVQAVAPVTTDEDTSVSGRILATDVDGDTLSYTVADNNGPAHGMVTVDAQGNWTYTPGANYHGADSFVVTVSDGTALVDTTVNLTVNSVNDVPVTVADSAEVHEHDTATFDLVANDTDVEDGKPHLTDFAVTGVDGINVSNDAAASAFQIVNGQLQFTGGDIFGALNDGDHATVTVAYTATDNDGGHATGEFVLTVDGVTDLNPITGTSGSDELTDTAGADHIVAGDGNDIIYSSFGDDVIDAGTGNDTVFTLTGDKIVNGGDGNDTITGGTGDSTLNGDAGNDTILGAFGNETINGGDGNDTLTSGTGIDTISGGDGNDSIYGGVGNSTLNGDAGNDSILGGTGNETINGGAGNDLLMGGIGDDVLAGGAGNDQLFGGVGSDTFIFAVGDGKDTVFDFQAQGIGHDVIQLDRAAFADFLSLMSSSAVHDVHGSVEIDYADGSSLTLTGVTKASLKVDDFHFA